MIIDKRGLSAACDEAVACLQVRNGQLRIVSAKRKRKLRRKGVRVWWHAVLSAWVWSPIQCASTPVDGVQLTPKDSEPGRNGALRERDVHHA